MQTVIQRFRQTAQNNPARAGQFAARKVMFGEFNRYAVAPVHTRFNAVQWFVWDSEAPKLRKSDAGPVVIRQEASLKAALKGLD